MSQSVRLSVRRLVVCSLLSGAQGLKRLHTVPPGLKKFTVLKLHISKLRTRAKHTRQINVMKSKLSCPGCISCINYTINHTKLYCPTNKVILTVCEKDV